MPNQFETAPEKIPTKDEVLEVIARFAENSTFVRELSDARGIYLLETKIEGKEPGEIIQYEYMRKGRHGNNNESSETAIHRMYYQDEMPVGGDKIAVYRPDTSSWEEIR